MFNIDFSDVEKSKKEKPETGSEPDSEPKPETEIIERLESKLAEKEKELRELKMMKESEIMEIKSRIKKELEEEIKKELANIKDELKKELKDDIVREVVNELKNEIYDLKKSIENEGFKAERLKTVEAKVLEVSKTVENLAKEILYIRSEKTLQVKPRPSRERIKQQLKSSRTTKLVDEKEDSDIIVCD